MKYVGFLKEHDNITEALSLSAARNSTPTKEITKIIEYLDHGAFLFGWMGYVFDVESGSPIAPDSYFTDGTWVWPGYFSYYLKKFPELKFDTDFEEYLKVRNYEFGSETELKASLGDLEKEFIQKINSNR